MAKTKFKIKVKFLKKVPLSHVASSKLQKEKGGQKTTKTLGTTKPHVAFPPPELHWEELTDPIAKTVKLSLKKVIVKVEYSAKIWLDKGVDRNSPCYAHIFEHEKRHARIWNAGVKKYGKKIAQAVIDATAPTMDEPVEVASAKAAALRKDSYDKIYRALDSAVLKYGKIISKESKVIHTPGELKKTNKLCAPYLM